MIDNHKLPGNKTSGRPWQSLFHGQAANLVRGQRCQRSSKNGIRILHKKCFWRKASLTHEQAVVGRFELHWPKRKKHGMTGEAASGPRRVGAGRFWFSLPMSG